MIPASICITLKCFWTIICICLLYDFKGMVVPTCWVHGSGVIYRKMNLFVKQTHCKLLKFIAVMRTLKNGLGARSPEIFWIAAFGVVAWTR